MEYLDSWHFVREGSIVYSMPEDEGEAGTISAFHGDNHAAGFAANCTSRSLERKSSTSELNDLPLNGRTGIGHSFKDPEDYRDWTAIVAHVDNVFVLITTNDEQQAMTTRSIEYERILRSPEL